MRRLVKYVVYATLVFSIALAGCTERGSGSNKTTQPPSTEFSFDVYADPPAGGTVSPQAGKYRDGWTFAATATPASGYRFASWSGDVPVGQSAIANPITVVMDRSRTLHANFEPLPAKVALTTGVDPPGAGDASPASGEYSINTVVSISASAKPGYRFTSWSGDVPAGGATANPVTLTMDQAKTLHANFEPLPRADLTILTSIAAAPTTVAAGEAVTLSGWTIKNQREAETGSFSNGFYLSTDYVIAASDTYLDGNTNGSLAPGAQFIWGGPRLTIPRHTSPGDYYVGILVDREDLIHEFDESNNSVLARITVTAGFAGTVYEWALTASSIPFGDYRVRQALCLAIDEQAISNTVFPGGNARLEARYDFTSGQNSQPLAKQLMWEAGYPNGFKTSLFAAPDDPSIRALASAIASHLAGIGVNVTVSFYPSSAAFPSGAAIALTIAP